MASDASVFAATEAPPATRPAAAATPPSIIPSDEAVRLLKRPRSPSPTSPRLLTSPSRPLISFGSPSKSARLALATRGSPPSPLTGAAALDDERRRRDEEAEQERAQNPPLTSENPTQKAMASLMAGAVQAMSRPADAPQAAPTASMETSPNPPNPVSLAQSATGQLMERGAASPQSTTSVVGVVTESPTPMEVDAKGEHAQSSQQVAAHEERPQPGSLSYPGSLQSSANLTETPVRGMSFPSPSQGHTSPTSASNKKHKCPYCNTEFTRHHNLKSHLLTHSQEKPYVCTECQMRFRRLHDLKRHGKLHTGEKPHICPKCDRKFARGDALARHSKGAGGCAGRRSSMGSFADGDDLDGAMADPDDSAMSGLAYDNEEEELRRQSLPSISAQHVAGSQGDAYGPHSRSYPPGAPRSAASGLYPPNVNQTQAASNSSPTATNNLAGSHTGIALASGNANVYQQGSITESPKPLSPGQESASIGPQRSPSMPQQLQQQQYGRRQSDLQSPHSGQPRPPKLPGLSHPGFVAPNSAGYSHTRTGSGAAQAGSDSGNMFAQSDPSVWAYVQSLEEKIKSLSDKVTSLDHEVVTLKQQLENHDTSNKT